MEDIEKKAQEQAGKHYRQFMDNCEWPDMLEKYAELSNKYKKARKELVDRHERGARLEDADFADVAYYERYCDLMAWAIADNVLVSEGYEEDRNKNWILKYQPADPPKKKFGFWG